MPCVARAEPYTLISDEFVPGLMSPDKELFYQVLEGDFAANDLLTVTPSDKGATVFLLASIGSPPSRAVPPTSTAG